MAVSYLVFFFVECILQSIVHLIFLCKFEMQTMPSIISSYFYNVL